MGLFYSTPPDGVKSLDQCGTKVRVKHVAVTFRVKVSPVLAVGQSIVNEPVVV